MRHHKLRNNNMYNINMFGAHQGYKLTKVQSTTLYLVNLILTRLTQGGILLFKLAVVVAFVKIVWYGLSL